MSDYLADLLQRKAAERDEARRRINARFRAFDQTEHDRRVARMNPPATSDLVDLDALTDEA